MIRQGFSRYIFTQPSPLIAHTLRHSRACGNSTSHYSNTRKNTPSFPKTFRHPQKHSVIPKNTPSFPRRRESIIPAHAGIQRPTTPIPEKTLHHFPKTLRHSQKHSVIPAKAGIQIPAHAGIQRPTTPIPVIPAFAGMTLR